MYNSNKPAYMFSSWHIVSPFQVPLQDAGVLVIESDDEGASGPTPASGIPSSQTVDINLIIQALEKINLPFGCNRL